ncbi:hypothetical protein R3P38DRAFT_3532586 [Favolaschia claudopus]|uniref:Uncharacterized protein n=1 Tax=Favolaschia claudopus TaxID=2862362 RepID=A0AAW0BEG1_9AGAR
MAPGKVRVAFSRCVPEKEICVLACPALPRLANDVLTFSSAPSIQPARAAARRTYRPHFAFGTPTVSMRRRERESRKMGVGALRGSQPASPSTLPCIRPPRRPRQLRVPPPASPVFTYAFPPTMSFQYLAPPFHDIPSPPVRILDTHADHRLPLDFFPPTARSPHLPDIASTLTSSTRPSPLTPRPPDAGPKSPTALSRRGARSRRPFHSRPRSHRFPAPFSPATELTPRSPYQLRRRHYPARANTAACPPAPYSRLPHLTHRPATTLPRRNDARRRSADCTEIADSHGDARTPSIRSRGRRGKADARSWAKASY